MNNRNHMGDEEEHEIVIDNNTFDEDTRIIYQQVESDHVMIEDDGDDDDSFLEEDPLPKKKVRVMDTTTLRLQEKERQEDFIRQQRETEATQLSEFFRSFGNTSFHGCVIEQQRVIPTETWMNEIVAHLIAYMKTSSLRSTSCNLASFVDLQSHNSTLHMNISLPINKHHIEMEMIYIPTLGLLDWEDSQASRDLDEALEYLNPQNPGYEEVASVIMKAFLFEHCKNARSVFFRFRITTQPYVISQFVYEGLSQLPVYINKVYKDVGIFEQERTSLIFDIEKRENGNIVTKQKIVPLKFRPRKDKLCPMEKLKSFIRHEFCDPQKVEEFLEKIELNSRLQLCHLQTQQYKIKFRFADPDRIKILMEERMNLVFQDATILRPWETIPVLDTNYTTTHCNLVMKLPASDVDMGLWMAYNEHQHLYGWKASVEYRQLVRSLQTTSTSTIDRSYAATQVELICDSMRQYLEKSHKTGDVKIRLNIKESRKRRWRKIYTQLFDVLFVKKQFGAPILDGRSFRWDFTIESLIIDGKEKYNNHSFKIPMIFGDNYKEIFTLVFDNDFDDKAILRVLNARVRFVDEIDELQRS